ncbi:MAG: hypothetical protein HYU47_11810, partial [Deltaproteobacteria bacterium]|nr:hypothetical protein [Deltaproteobacteria bacterium]
LFAGHLEAMVRRYPDQWNWLGFHRNGRTPRSEIGKEAEGIEQSPSPPS